MSVEEMKETEEKTYTLDSIIQEITVNPETDPDGKGLTKQNISNYLKNLFESMGLFDAKKILRDGKAFAFTEQEKEIIKKLIMERNGKLKRYKGGEHKGEIEQPDFEFLFGITRGIRAMLSKRGYKEDKLYDVMEKYMTDFLRNEASISKTISQKIQDAVERNITNETTYLRTYDKFLWMRAMEEELDRVIDKWDDIFREYEKLTEKAVHERNEQIYFEPHEIESGGETVIKSVGQLFAEYVNKHLEEEYREEWELLAEEERKLRSDMKNNEKYHKDQIDYYGKWSDKSVMARSSRGNEYLQMLKEKTETESRLSDIEKRRNQIYTLCQEAAYEKLYGENEPCPVPGMPHPEELLLEAKERMVVQGKSRKMTELQDLLKEAADKAIELKKFMEIE